MESKDTAAGGEQGGPARRRAVALVGWAAAVVLAVGWLAAAPPGAALDGAGLAGAADRSAEVTGAHATGAAAKVRGAERSGAQATGRPGTPDGPGSGGAGWRAPLPGGADALEVAAPFDPPAENWLPGHRGVDLAAPPGTDVLSPAPGTVTFAGPVAGRVVLVVLHDDGLRSSFEPVAPVIAVGTRVGTGSVVATLADVPGHCAPTACLHWGVRRGDVYLDPLALLGDRPPIVLLPDG